MSPVSASTPEERLAKLRRLSAEFRQFRSPEVQTALENTPLQGADNDIDDDRRTDQTFDATMRARMFSMKTELVSLRRELQYNQSELKKYIQKEESLKESYEERIRGLELDSYEKTQVCTELEKTVAKLKTDKERLEVDVREKDGYLREAGAREQRLLDDLKESTDKEIEKLRKSVQQNEKYKAGFESVATRRNLEARLAVKEKELLSFKMRNYELEAEDERRARRQVEDEFSKVHREKGEEVQSLNDQIAKLVSEKNKLESERDRLGHELDEESTKRRSLEKTKSLYSDQEVRNLQDTIAKLKQEAKEDSESRLIIESLRAEKAKMAELVSSLSSAKNPSEGFEILRKAAEDPSTSNSIQSASNNYVLEEREKAHKEQLAALTSDTNKLRAKQAAVEHENSTMRSKVSQLRSRLNAKEAEILRVKELLTIIEVERTGLHNILQSVQSSLRNTKGQGTSQAEAVAQQLAIANASVNKCKDAAKRATDTVAKRDEQIASLSARLSALADAQSSRGGDDEVVMLKGRLIESVKVAAEQKAGLEKAEEKIRRLERTVSSLTLELDELGKVKEGYQVVHMKDNPFSAARSEFREGESRSGLKRRRVGDDGEPEDESHLHARLAELEKKEKLAERYKAIAKRKIEELRTACYSIFGWDMRIHGANYTVASMYAEKEEDKLVFADTGRGVMSLIENEYCKSIQSKIDQYLTQCHSIPALLADITYENFEKTTLMPS